MKSKIEISPKEYWIRDVTYNEAILYCFQLTIDGKTGWRIFKDDREYDTAEIVREFAWVETDEHDDLWDCVPVRDIT